MNRDEQRDGDQGDHHDGDHGEDDDTDEGKRHEAHIFMPGKFVFPCGRIEAEDRRMSAASALDPRVEARLMQDVQRYRPYSDKAGSPPLPERRSSPTPSTPSPPATRTRSSRRSRSSSSGSFATSSYSTTTTPARSRASNACQRRSS